MSQLPEFHRSGHVMCQAPARLDRETASDLMGLIEELSVWSSHMILDLRAVEHLDSYGIAALVWAVRRLRALGGEAVLLAPAPAHQLLAFGGALGRVELYDDLAKVPDVPPPGSLSTIDDSFA